LMPAHVVQEEHWAQIDGDRLRYLKAGAGPPLLLVHGLLGGCFCWRHNIAALAEHFTVYAVDLPGSGLADAPPHCDCSMKRQAERLLGFIEQLQLEAVSVVGISFGGAVCMLLAAEDARRKTGKIHALVLSAPVNPWSAYSRGRLKFLGTWLGGLLLQLALPVSKPVHNLALRRMYGDPSHIQNGVAQAYARMSVRPGRSHNLLSVIRNWWRDVDTLRAVIPEIKVPTLLLWGTRDGAVDPRSCVPLQQHLGNAQCVQFPGIGHLPCEEAPEEFNRAVLEFLKIQ
jgi:pimeloyl-ACP methyl ester carboxylesterase